MKSKRSLEGYLVIDHRASPGIGPREINMMDGDLPMGIGRTMFECPTYTCSHCQRVVILNPMRTRERAYCRKCDHYVCDECNVTRLATNECKTFEEIIEDVAEQVAKEQSVKEI